MCALKLGQKYPVLYSSGLQQILLCLLSSESIAADIHLLKLLSKLTD